ncbi:MULTISPECIES: substrate-binding domain-containing protein [Nocardioides]|uniref:Substrate-binding domain-containing protein n=1 Tax=Nocardioides vastitatis TaxID=2568655 RepID=A0ABW0ZK20_9ACTN|nr:substrate-binding domain-containing protein [Nocardioides sp.]
MTARAMLPALTAACALLGGGCSVASDAASSEAILATTTSTQDSGLLDELLPDFEKEFGCTVKTVAVGSGEALELGERGNADVLLVHSPGAEREFMDGGHGVSREPVMHNDFVIVGPEADPANLEGAADAADALVRIAETESLFASRGDDSGTHAKELALWEEAGVDAAGEWYFETGQGMGQTLTIAGQRSAYALTDRGTFLATANLDSTITFEGSGDLQNFYHVIVVDRGEEPVSCAEELATWIREPDVQKRIGDFGVEQYGEPLFVPDAEAGEE